MLIKLFTTLYYTVYKVQSKPLYTKIRFFLRYFPLFRQVLTKFPLFSCNSAAAHIKFMQSARRTYEKSAFFSVALKRIDRVGNDYEIKFKTFCQIRRNDRRSLGIKHVFLADKRQFSVLLAQFGINSLAFRKSTADDGF